jgi:membrane-bound lytic murein transglycosylase B
MTGQGMGYFKFVSGLIGSLLLTVATLSQASANEDFATWLSALESEALSKGLDGDVVGRALEGVQPIGRIIELDRRQPEFSLTFAKYLSGAISDARIAKGRELLAKHKTLLQSVARKHGVQPRFLVSFWGLETNFGQYFGSFPLVGALATLAHDERRAKFFRAQLLAALKIMSDGDIPVDVKSSWAGAMGNFQFIPTTYLDSAIDGDGDGRRDLWGSLNDAFSSAANYLSRSGWNSDRTWGREVQLPDGFDFALAGLDTRKSLAQWQALGIRRAGGGNLPTVDIEGSILVPAGHRGPAFIVYSNFNAIMTWNRSIFYAIAVGHLSDRLVGKSGLVKAPPTDEKPLSRDQATELQNLLTANGFDTGGADGVLGPMSRKAIRAYQISKGLPPDSYPSLKLLERIRNE